MENVKVVSREEMTKWFVELMEEGDFEGDFDGWSNRNLNDYFHDLVCDEFKIPTDAYNDMVWDIVVNNK